MMLNNLHLYALTTIGLAFMSACSTATLEEPLLAESVTDDARASTESKSDTIVVTEEPAMISLPRKSTRPTPRSGIVTAGDIDDTRNLAAFQSYLKRANRKLQLPSANLSRPVLAQLTGPGGRPAPGVHVTIRKPGATQPFYTGTSGVDGYITVFPAVLGAGRPAVVELRAISDGQNAATIQNLKAGSTRHQIALTTNSTWQPDFLDLAFVVDTTGSMGDELTWLTREMQSIVTAARRSAPGVNIRYGLIVYRDHGDSYVVRNMGFTSSAKTMQGWLKHQNASGGGDYPEAAAAALKTAVSLDWRRGRGERLLFHIADAPPHKRDAQIYIDAARVAATRNIQIFGLGASGVGDEAEYLIRQAAAMTSGRYLFLTDDSGVGLSHGEPNIACYRVTQLKSLLIRVLKSELTGLRNEAPKKNVIREVGAYRSGVCIN